MTCTSLGMLAVIAVTVVHIAGAWQSTVLARGPFWSWCPWSLSRTRAQLKGVHPILKEPAQDLPALRHDLTQQLITQHLHAALPLGRKAHVTNRSRVRLQGAAWLSGQCPLPAAGCMALPCCPALSTSCLRTGRRQGQAWPRGMPPGWPLQALEAHTSSAGRMACLSRSSSPMMRWAGAMLHSPACCLGSLTQHSCMRT